MKYALGILLLALGFASGIAWQNTTQRDEISQTDYGQRDKRVEEVSLPEETDYADNLTDAELATIRLFETAEPSVVYITTTTLRRDFFRGNIYESPTGSGSGFIWDKNGHVVTNYHVIRGASRARVTLADQSTWDASLVGYARDKDLAVLKIETDRQVLYPIDVGQSTDLKVGQSVFAIGNPFGYDRTLTTGVISALDREIQSVNGVPIRDVIQTDAAINPGNSGGPLLDSQGKLIGVNTQIVSPSGAYAGIGFSIPVDAVKWVIPDLIRYGEIRRPRIAVSFASDNITERAGIKGALIIEVLNGSEAERAGLQPTYLNRAGNIVLGDIITAINGEKIQSKNDVILALEKYQPGDMVMLSVLRGKKEITVEITLEEPS